MAMVRAVKGSRVITVSRSSYEKMFKNAGYVLEEKIIKEVMNDFEEQEKQEEQNYEVPISEMTKEQLMNFAKEHNIDTSKAGNVREAKKIIQKAIREENM